jgi:hypothetical protein
MDNISANQGQVILRNYEISFGTDPTYNSFGLVNEIKLSYKPTAVVRDSKGRSFAPGYDVLIEFSQMQTASAVLASVFESMQIDNPATLRLVKGSNGFSIGEVKPVFEVEGDGAGGISKIKVRADRYLTHAEMQNIILGAE